MTALIVIGIILLVFIAIALLRVGVTAIYSEQGAVVKLRIGPFKIQLLPGKEGKEKKEKKKKTEKKFEDKKPEQEKKSGGLEGFKQLLGPILNAAGRFKRKLRINRLVIHYTIGGLEDAAKAAENYGKISMAMGTLVPVLENNFDIRSRELVSDIDFTTEKSKIYAEATLTLAVWSLFYIGAGFLFPFLAIKKTNAEASANGKSAGKANETKSNEAVSK